MIQLLLQPGPSAGAHLSRGEGGRTTDLNKFGRTPLHLAASKGHAAAAKVLASHGARSGGKGGCGEGKGGEGKRREAKRAILVADRFGWTPLHLAAANSHEPAVKVLFAAGSNGNAEDVEGRNPLQLAEAKGASKRVRDTLRNHEAAMTAAKRSGEKSRAAHAAGGGGRKSGAAKLGRSHFDHMPDPDRSDSSDGDGGDELLAWRRGK